jgi:two-component system response regulator WspF
MDLIMPVMDGAEATRRIMAETPCPIIVVTSVKQSNFRKVFEAMSHGALDVIDTPTVSGSGEVQGGAALLGKIATVAKLIGRATSSVPAYVAVGPSNPSKAGEALVAIAASTGGPSAVADVLAAIPKRWTAAAVVVVMHMDVAFAPGLARWLSDRTGHPVATARPGARPQPGEIVVAATNDHLVLDLKRQFVHVEEPKDLCFRPSADILFTSLALNWPGPGVGVLLTGMGRDGANGLLALRRAGWMTIAQDKASSVVWGMPRAAIEMGAASKILPLSEIGAAVVDQIHHQVGNDKGTAS